MNRRRVLAALTAAMAGGPRVAFAETGQDLARIAIIHTAPGPRSFSLRAVLDGLAQIGYVDGRNVYLDVRSAQGRPALLAKIVDEILRLKPRVIVVIGPAALRAAKAATDDIPIIAIDLETDPVAAGFVQSLAHPGGNVTGAFLNFAPLAAKWLDLLHEIAPSVRKVGIVWDATTGRYQLDTVQAAAAKLAIETVVLEIRSADDFSAIFRKPAPAGMQGLLMLSSPINNLRARETASYAMEQRLPGIAPFRDFAESGGLIAYGPNLLDFYRQVPQYIDKIIKGSSASELPVQQPTTFVLVINARTARRLGLPITQALYARADEVIE